MNSFTRKGFIKTVGGSIAAISLFPWLTSKTSHAPKAPNILFLFSDDSSPEDFGAYGNKTIKTPHLDKLASEGMRFTRAYCASPQCTPSRTSMLTGQYPHNVHVSRLHAIMPKDEINIVSLLNKYGYYTGAYRKVDQPTVQECFKFYGGNEVPLETFFKRRPKDKPFFLHFGSHDSHRLYNRNTIKNVNDPADVRVPDFLPDTKKVRMDLANYCDKISRFDRDCGFLLSLLDKHGLAQNTMVVWSSDQGMPFPRSKPTLYEAGLKVPLAIRWPEVVKPDQVSDAKVSLIDLAATWLEAAGIPVPYVIQSRSLFPVLSGKKTTFRKYIFAERNWHDNWDPNRTIIGDKYKLIQRYRPEFPYTPSLDVSNSPSYKEILRLELQNKLSDKLKWYRYNQSRRPHVEFYNLEDDPGEWDNLVEGGRQRKHADQKKRVYRFQLMLSKWMEKNTDFLPPPRLAFGSGQYTN